MLARRRAERGPQQQPAGGGQRARASRGAHRIGDRPGGALQGLQRDVASEPVGHHHVGLTREQVAPLEVADESDPLRPGQGLVGLDHIGPALLLLLADGEQGDTGALHAEHRPAEKAEPRKANWIRCCGRTSVLAPQSRKRSGGPSVPGTGIWTASAGLWTPWARFSANRAAVMVAPVDPALTSELHSPAATAAAARTTEASGVERTAATGSASLPIHSVVGLQLDPGRGW